MNIKFSSYFFTLGVLFTAMHLGFFLLSEEVLVFLASLLFLTLLFSFLRRNCRFYFFRRAYEIFLVFLSALLTYALLLARLSLVLRSLLLFSQLHGTMLLRDQGLTFA